MAVYIRFASSENVAPIIVGQMITPSRYNWNSSGGNADCTGDFVSGTGLIGWWYTYDPGFQSFFNNSYVPGNVSATYKHSWKLYSNEEYSLQLQLEVTSYPLARFDVRILHNGTTVMYYPTSSWNGMLQRYPKPLPESIANDFLSGYGPFFVCNPHIQEKPDYMALAYNFSDNMSGYYPQGWKGTFQPFYDFNQASTRAAILEILFSKSGQSAGPDSAEDGGWGNFDDETETIGLPGVPSISALDTGFVRMYNPTAQELQQFASFIWSTNFFTNVIKNFSDPMQAIVSLAISPVAPTVSQQETNIVVGNLPAFTEQESTITPIMAAPLTSQYVTVNCGSITLNEYWGSALDYSPYSKCEIYLPYIGVQNLSIDDVMGSTLTLQYNVDLLTGICTAVLKCVKSQHMDFDAALYHWSGNMISNLPISGSNFAQVITALTSSIVSAGIPIVTGAGGAAIASGVVGGVMNMMNAKAQVQKSGSISMQSGALDNQIPYLILTRPIQSKAANYPAYKGWTTNITAEIGSLSGYTEVEYVHVEVAGATDAERNEIERLLKEGVII